MAVDEKGEASELMKIGTLSDRAGLNQRTIHFYEKEGLIEPVQREGRGYRYYDESSIETLRLVSRLKFIGLSLEEIRDVLPLYASDATGAQGKVEVLRILRSHLKGTDNKIAELRAFRDELIVNVAKLEMFLREAQGEPVTAETPVSIHED